MYTGMNYFLRQEEQAGKSFEVEVGCSTGLPIQYTYVETLGKRKREVMENEERISRFLAGTFHIVCPRLLKELVELKLWDDDMTNQIIAGNGSSLYKRPFESIK
ncbi:hypothetical protein JB92DRAFT_2829103 [Gautieria morchelliformis]|nr:hypothetical protein JB92DRAFT_2829103 [Gautieria morchelliformis]